MATIKFDDYLNEKLKDTDFRAGYLAESAKLESAVALFKAREAAGITQQALADRAALPVTMVEAVEAGDNTDFETMSKLAFALNKKLTVRFDEP
ncbi:MAG TPA: helix-turn-helix domain-containing protein [Candidatus Levilactobacillus faecigallinarum]|uniref:Helix-turn-helix domain-containing protein n=1 Tax=Candidatus Levilactobacillus faecigallinarum TaxID=2838638 RepID=A0A9D1U4Y9_9LACO|nr:helix-turn-helix domain-containing protein [Candidatus Levilactobacillus faecigallinarum]